jgi:hypothetical protein
MSSGNDLEFFIDTKDMTGQDPIRQTPKSCKRCFHVWIPTDFNWILGVFKEPVWCPNCISPKWDQPFEEGQGPQPGSKGVVRAYSPKADIEFWSRENWLANQAKLRKTTGNYWLPVPIELKEFAKEEIIKAARERDGLRDIVDSVKS